MDLSVFKVFKLCFFLLLGSLGHAQCVIQIDTSRNTADLVFLASELNGWSPNDSSMLFHDGLLTIFSPLKSPFEGKLTLGAWDRAEVDSLGNFLQNRLFDCSNQDTIRIQPVFENRSRETLLTSIPGLVSDSMFFPFDQKCRGIKLISIINDSSSSFFNVFLFFDGQNIFSNSSNAFGSWAIDRCLVDLKIEGKNILIVGIDHAGDKRLREYAPFDHPPLILNSYGPKFGDYLVKRILPWIVGQGFIIDQLFVGGSSLGALMAWHMVSSYSDFFDGAILFSPSFWLFDENTFPKYSSKILGKKIMVLAGGLEGASMKDNAIKFVESFPSSSQILYRFDESGKHNEAFWSKHICSAISFCINNP